MRLLRWQAGAVASRSAGSDKRVCFLALASFLALALALALDAPWNLAMCWMLVMVYS